MASIEAGRAAARRLVEGILEEHGYLGEEELGQMSPQLRRKVENAMFRKDQIIASSVVAYALPYSARLS
jgi:hypothetical protein